MLTFRKGGVLVIILIIISSWLFFRVVDPADYIDVDIASYLPTKDSAPFPPDGATFETAAVAKICERRHGILYKDIESTEAYWAKVGGMTERDLETSRYVCERDGGCTVIKLYQGQLFIRHPIYHPLSFQSRGLSSLLMLSHVDLSHHADTDFMVDSNDGPRPNAPCFFALDKHLNASRSQSREQAINPFLFPDFTTLSWWEAELPAFNEARMQLADAAGSFHDKVPKLFWRGAPVLQQGTQRKDLLEQLGPQTDIADVKEAHRYKKESFVSLPGMCQYRYIIYTEGVTYSGRLKYTSLCNSVQIGHPITFYEFWTHLLDPFYVNVTDWNDAVTVYHRLQEDPERSASLARGAVDALRQHMSPTGISCYIQRVVDGYRRSTRWKVLSPENDFTGKNSYGNLVSNFTWVSLDAFLARAAWQGTVRESINWTQPIRWDVKADIEA